MTAWKEHARFFGKRVKVTAGRDQFDGIAEDLDKPDDQCRHRDQAEIIGGQQPGEDDRTDQTDAANRSAA